ncbi:Reverse transcriptase domain [Trinorchestia longiramus]|nr:Reverse transcriptase domain [Trinorchestia longiramus]
MRVFIYELPSLTSRSRPAVGSNRQKFLSAVSPTPISHSYDLTYNIPMFLSLHPSLVYPYLYDLGISQSCPPAEISNDHNKSRNPPTRIPQKISNLGIDTQWFQSYLSNCSHALRLEKTISSPIQNDFGVPLGSILGPLLFSIFINDFPSIPSNTRISVYADDVQIAMTTALAKLPHTKTNAERLLKHVKSWCDQNGLKPRTTVNRTCTVI